MIEFYAEQYAVAVLLERGNQKIRNHQKYPSLHLRSIIRINFPDKRTYF